MKLKKKSIKNDKKNAMNQLGLTYQTCDPGNKIGITQWKKI
jgi:hypothetical protein